MNKQAPTKQVEDYEPISGGAVCLAVACTLGVGLLMGAFSETKAADSEVKKNIPEKISTQSVLKTPGVDKERVKE